MANKSSVNKKFTLTAKGILDIDGTLVGVEDEKTGEMFLLHELLSDFADRSIKLTVAYDEELGSGEVSE